MREMQLYRNHHQCPWVPKWGIRPHGTLASFPISPVATIAPLAQLMNTLSGVWQGLVLHPLLSLIVELVISIIELVLWGEVISLTSNPQPGGPGFFCRRIPFFSQIPVS